MAWALLIEIYREYGLKFEEAMTELNKVIMGPQAPETQKATERSDASAMAMLQSMMGDSDFKGPRG